MSDARAEAGDLAARLAAWARDRLAHARHVRVLHLERIHGGASRETYRFVLAWEADGRRRERALVLRRDAPASLIETERRVEFAAYRAFHGTPVPVPEPLGLEEDPAALGAPFFVMDALEGEASPKRLFAPPYLEQREKIGRRKWAILGEIARADPKALGLTDVLPEVAPDAAWRRELDRWERMLDADALEPQPIARAAIRWLRRASPPPAQRVAVVHADYRTGNFLVDASGAIRGILDWEMVHLGDPLEDLAWSLNRVWCWTRDERVGGLLPRPEAIRVWEAASGLRADPVTLRWWEVFSCVKGQAIWVSAAREFQEGRNRDPVMAFSCWMQGNSQDRATLALLGHLP